MAEAIKASNQHTRILKCPHWDCARRSARIVSVPVDDKAGKWQWLAASMLFLPKWKHHRDVEEYQSKIKGILASTKMVPDPFNDDSNLRIPKSVLHDPDEFCEFAYHYWDAKTKT